jgi:hypothetical protein
LKEESELLRKYLYKRESYKQSLGFYFQFLKFWREKVKEIDLAAELNRWIADYFRILLIEGGSFGSHDAWNVCCVIDWFIKVRFERKIELNGIEKILMNKIKRFFSNLGIDFPLEIYKE